MTVVRCSQKLFKRLRPAPVLAEPSLGDNPLGEWCADMDFIDREPFVVLMNACSGTILVLPGRAADLKRLHEMAAEQLAGLFSACRIHSASATAELDAWQQPPTYSRNSNRSLVASMNQRKFEAWTQFAYNGLSAFDVAVRLLETPFSRKDLGRDFNFAPDLLRKHLMPSATVIPLFTDRRLN